jgi:hypothetical protein
MEFVFITKIIPNLLKNDESLGDNFFVFFQVQMVWHKLFWKVKGEYWHSWKKKKVSFVPNVRRRLKVFFFLGSKYVQNILFAPIVIPHFFLSVYWVM